MTTEMYDEETELDYKNIQVKSVIDKVIYWIDLQVHKIRIKLSS